MKVSITSIKLRSIWKLPALTFHLMKVKSQSRKAGAKDVIVKGSGTLHYALSLWDDEKSIEAFMKSGAHQEAMKKSRNMAEEIQVLTIDREKLPELSEAKTLLEKEGKTYRY